MGKQKIFEIHIPIQGEMKVLKTDLICNACGKRLEHGQYLYFCCKCEDDLCSNYSCLKKHAGHAFFRWGRIETGKLVSEMVKDRPAPPRKGDAIPPIKINTVPVPMAPPAGPASPDQGPTINTGALSALRTEMLKELKCLMSIEKEED